MITLQKILNFNIVLLIFNLFFRRFEVKILYVGVVSYLNVCKWVNSSRGKLDSSLVCHGYI